MTGSATPQADDTDAPGSTWHPGMRTASPAPGVALVALVVLGLVLACATAAWKEASNARVTAERLDVAVLRVASVISERMAKYEYGLRGARGAIVAAGEDGITRGRFRDYSLTRDIDREFPGTRGFGFIRRVDPAREAAFLEAARRDGAPDFALRQITPHPGERYVIQYLEPVEPNRPAIGLDVASEDHRRGAALAAMETGQATLTAPITLVQASGLRERGLLLYLPIARMDPRGATVAERRARTIGWAYAPLVIDEVLAGLDLNLVELDLAISDATPEALTRFYGTGDALASVDPALVRRRTVAVFGRSWDLEVRALPPFVSGLNLTSPATAGGTVLVAMLMFAGIAHLRLTGRRREVLAGVERSRLAAIVENAEDAIVGKTLDGTVTDWNPAAERLFGFTAPEAIGRNARDLVVPPHLRAEERETLDRVRLGKPVAPLSTLRLHRDGNAVPVLVTVSPIRSPRGETVGVATVIRDIGAQLAAEEEIRTLNASLERQVAERTSQLRAASAWQDAILRHAGYAVIATDLDGTISLFNPAAERMLGYAAGELVGTATPGLFHDPREVADRAAELSAALGERVEPGFEVFVARARRGMPETAEWTYVTKAGERHPVLLNVSLLRTADGPDLGYLGIAMDLSERRRHEAEMKAANAGTWSYDVATGLVRLSAECARQHGLPDAETEIDVERGWRPLAHPADVGHVLADLGAAVETGGSYTTEFRIPLPNGGLRWISAMGRVETDADGRTSKVLGLTLDVTPRKLAEIALGEAKAQAEAARSDAERANQAKTDFLASMSHEIRTPLNAIIGFTDLMLASDRLAPDLHRHADLVRASGAALLAIVNDILDFSKVEAGAVELAPRPFALSSLLDACTSIVRAQAETKGLQLRTSLGPDLPGWVLGDEGRLRQVLLNLLNNAVKFTKAGSVTLDVSSEPAGPAERVLRLRVTDTGIGIPEEKRKRLFQRFSQVDGSIGRDYGGTGLGLAISRSLVELMGGEIGVGSDTGRGSSFWFSVTLPLADAPDGQATVPAASVARRKGRLLLVDDSPINLELAKAVLTGAGHDVEVAGEGATAVAAVAAGGFDLVLMDVQMPGMDGMSATRAIRHSKLPTATIPVIAMTANVLPEQVRAFREAGMDDHVGKPFEREALFATIERWLGAGTSASGVPVERRVPASFDRSIYEQIGRYLKPNRLHEVLHLLIAELRTSFQGDAAMFDARSWLRHRAHSLSSATGMMGFVDLATACHALECCGEDRLDREGVEVFGLLLEQVRRLSDDAVVLAEELSRGIDGTDRPHTAEHTSASAREAAAS
ncbi:CHASE domain-containing protein [Methylobacterium sp. Leaf89]|uniref:CHASE domain-containing protein n=1 Tax=Methylobacterium sp. Leaf89 TaxID=1736245 RepID=UPI000AA917BD|nr:CHASE domain-containing protein [Methylobacterium sp. Leaf89]